MLIDKGLYPVMILKALEDHADEDAPVSTNKLRSLIHTQFGLAPCRNTISATIEKLRLLGFDIICVRHHENEYYIRNRNLTFGEVTSLCDLVHSSFFISKEDSERIISKLLSILSLRQQALYRSQVHKENRKKDPYTKNFFDNYQMLKTACDHHFAIDVQYRSKPTLKNNKLHFTVKEYVVFPFEVVCNDGFAYLVGMADGKGVSSHFRIDRFDSITVSDDIPFPSKLKDYDYSRDPAFTPYMMSGKKIPATFLCNMKILSAVADRVSLNARFLNHPEDPDLFYLMIEAPEQSILYLAQQYMEGITLLEPAYLKEEYERRAAESLERSRNSKPFHMSGSLKMA